MTIKGISLPVVHITGAAACSRAALRPAFLVQRVAEPADDQPAHRGGVAEADLGLGGMDVDVDLVERDLEEQGRDRVAVAGDEVAIGGAQRADEQRGPSPAAS